MEDSTRNFLAGLKRLGDIIRHASGIQPLLFASLVFLRSLIRVLYFLASVLPFKILMILGSGYTIPSLLQPYFESKEALAYSLCLTIGLSIVGAKSCEYLIDKVKQQKARTFLGDGYTRKIKRRDNLVLIISKATDASSAIIIATLSIMALLFVHYQTGITTVTLSALCTAAIIFSRGDLKNFIISSPLKYLEKCVTGINLVAFLVLVYTSLNSSVPPGFLSLVVALILIRQYSQSVTQAVGVALSLKVVEERMERIFVGLS